MADQPKASKLRGEAFDQWQSGDFDRSKLLYEEAISLADRQHWSLPTYLAEYACVLNELGKHDQATTQMEESLKVELAQGNPEGSPNVRVARYFLATQLLRHGAPACALEVLAPSINEVPNDWCTRLAEAHVLFALNLRAEAKSAAVLAISNAPTPEKAEELEQDLAEVLGSADA
jgi:tetratricopeptide (TPR) repeat protein